MKFLKICLLQITEVLLQDQTHSEVQNMDSLICYKNRGINHIFQQIFNLTAENITHAETL